MLLNVSNLFCFSADIRIAKDAGKLAPRGEVICCVDGVIKRREYAGVTTWNTAKETFGDMLCAEDPFLDAYRRGETLHPRNVGRMLWLRIVCEEA